MLRMRIKTDQAWMVDIYRFRHNNDRCDKRKKKDTKARDGVNSNFKGIKMD